MAQTSQEQMSEDFYRQCEHAEKLLGDPLFDEVFAIVEAIYIDEWRVCEDRDRREQAWLLVQALHDIHKAFRVLAEKKVAHDLQHKAEDES